MYDHSVSESKGVLQNGRIATQGNLGHAKKLAHLEHGTHFLDFFRNYCFCAGLHDRASHSGTPHCCIPDEASILGSPNPMKSFRNFHFPHPQLLILPSLLLPL
jgi:hypothetical protein